MHKLHLIQPGFTFSLYRASSKHCKMISIFRETFNLKHLYKNALDKACFVHDAAYCESKVFEKRVI